MDLILTLSLIRQHEYHLVIKAFLLVFIIVKIFIINFLLFQLWRDPQEEPHKETAVTHLHSNARAPSPFIIIANKLLTGPVILNIGGKK